MVDTKLTAKIGADPSGYLKASEQMRREDERRQKQTDVALARQLTAEGKLTEEAFKAAKAQQEIGKATELIGIKGAAASKKAGEAGGGAVDFLGSKFKAFSSSLVSGAFAGLFAGIAGGSISSLLGKLFEPPTPEQQRATLEALAQNKAGLLSVYVTAEQAAAALKKMGEAETAALEKAQRHEDFTKVQGLVEQYDSDRLTLRYEQDLKLLDTAHLSQQSNDKARQDAFDKYFAAQVAAGNEFAALEEARKVGTVEQNRAIQLSRTLYDKESDGHKKAWATETAAANKFAGEAKSLTEYVRGLRDQLDPLGDEEGKYAATADKLADAVAHHVIVEEDRIEILKQLRLNLDLARDAQLDFLTGAGPAAQGGFGLIDLGGPSAQSLASQAAQNDIDRRQAAADAAHRAELQHRAELTDQFHAQIDNMPALDNIFGTGKDVFGNAEPQLAQLEALKTAFAGFADAAGAAYDAVVTGSEPAGKAFAKFLSGTLLGIGKTAAVKAIYEIAEAIANPFDAGRHLLAAAKYGATAVAAGIAASALGGGGGGGTSAGGAAPTGSYGALTGNGPQGTGQNTVFVYGDSFAEDSPRMRQQKAKRLLGLAGGGGPDDVRFS